MFDLADDDDLYFGVNGLSYEPTFALDNRLEDVVLDEYFYSMRNKEAVYPESFDVDDETFDYILRYKLLSDYMLSEKDMLNQIKEAIHNVSG